ncbi:MAG: amidohydrolase [Bryobacterales bacterium]|nr:amidohydrolase [Bryobacterales bacterium]
MRFSISLILLPLALFGEPADWLITARYLVPMDASRRVIEDGAVAVGGSRILAAGSRAEIEKRFSSRHRLDAGDAIIAPGLINAHTHAAMSLFRGIAGDVPLREWLENYIFPAEAKNVTPEFVRWGTKLAALEMMHGGTTTFADMYYFESDVAEATREAGLRGVLGETILKFPAPDFKTPQAALEYTARFIERFRGDPLIVPAVAPHAIYTNTSATLRAARALAARYGAPLLIHVSETERENKDSLAGHGLTPTAYLHSLGVLAGRTLLAHGVWLTDADMELVRQANAGVAHCPSSNLMLASGIAPVTAMLRHGISVGLGTDGPAGSNNDFNMMEEMDLAAKLQKVTVGDPAALKAVDAIAMATVLGARAIGMENEIGSLESGKKADLITIRLTRPHAVPLYDVYRQLVYALKASDVRDVMVNGRFVLRQGRSLTLPEAEVLSNARRLARKVVRQQKFASPAPGLAAQ